MFARAIVSLCLVAPLLAVASTVTRPVPRIGGPCNIQLIHPEDDPTLACAHFLRHKHLLTEINTQCLAAGPAAYADDVQNGQPTVLVPCAETEVVPTEYFSPWIIAPGEGRVFLVSSQFEVPPSGPGFCLDAGPTPENNGPAQVMQCADYPNVAPQQYWNLTADNRITIANGTQCLDRTNGDGQPQTYQCGVGNRNQAWIVETVNVCGSNTR